jgi:hypothetical protein
LRKELEVAVVGSKMKILVVEGREEVVRPFCVAHVVHI